MGADSAKAGAFRQLDRPHSVRVFVGRSATLQPGGAHPRRGAVRAVIRVLILAELLGEWPSAVGHVLVALLPKPDGGRSPIGLLPMLVRVWTRVRLQVAQAIRGIKP